VGLLDVSVEQAENYLRSMRVVVLDFYAEWCIPCKAVEEVLDQVSKAFRSSTDVAFLRIDVDRDKRAVERFEVYGLPTVIVFQKGLEVRRFTGVPRNLAIELAKLIKSLS